MAKRFTKPPHISERAWALAGGMTLRQLAGQLTSIDPGRYPQLTGEDIALAVARGEIGCVGLVGDRLRELQEIAVANGHPPLLVKDDGRRGFYLVAPFPLYCFDMGLVRRAHEQAAVDAQHAGVTLIRLTCDYSFAQNQGRTQEGGLISDPVFMSDVTRASTEGLTASGRIAVILKHMGPYQYTAGPDYTALPIERTEFLETVLPRYAGGFEAGAHGVMMGFVALNGVPAHADPFLRDLVKANAGPGAVIESDYDGIYELYGGFGYAGSPKEAALRAFREGGIHFDLASLLYLHHLPELVEEGRLGEEELLVRAAEVLDVKERVGLLDDPFMGTAADRTQVLLAGPATAYRDLATGLGGPAAADAAGPGGAADPDRGRAPVRPRAAGAPGPGGLDRRLLEPRQPPPRAGDDAARGDQAALAGRRPTRAAATTTATTAAATGGRCPSSAGRRRRRPGWPGRRRTSCSSSASGTSGAGNRRRWRSRGCRRSSVGSCRRCAGPIRGRS